MKKILSALLVSVCLLLAVPAQAQLHFGLKGGLNISKVTFSKDIVDGNNRTGFFIGPMAEFTIPVVGLGVDVAALYNQAGAKITIKDEEETSTESETLKSIEVPVNLKWTFGLGSTLGAYVAAGPQFGFNVGSGHFAKAMDIKTCYTSFNVGVGVKALQHLQVGLNYNFGISKLAKAVSDKYEGVDDSINSDLSMKKNTWQISVAYLF